MAPITIVLFLSAMKDLYEGTYACRNRFGFLTCADLKRARQDRKVNRFGSLRTCVHVCMCVYMCMLTSAWPCSRLVTVVCEDGSRQSVKWKDVAVGDLVEVMQDEQLPADIVIVSSALPSGMCYVETANLDGETNLKIHQSLKEIDSVANESNIHTLAGRIVCEVRCVCTRHALAGRWRFAKL